MKSFILVALALIGCLVYQNCGQKFQDNGDPYENDGIISITPPQGLPSDGQGLIPFVSELMCKSGSDSSQFKSVEFGTFGDVDSLRLTDRLGEDGIYSWNSVSNTYTLNAIWNESLHVISVKLEGQVATLKLQSSSGDFNESLSCQ